MVVVALAVAGNHVATSFLSFCWGWREGKGDADHTLVPATPEPTPRAYRYVEHVHGHELQWPGPRDNAPDLGSGDGKNGLRRP
jgi:hypothetical protein